jgi:hypothetical protein
VQEFVREPSEEEWERLAAYARRMRRFVDPKPPFPSEEVLELLNSRFSDRCMLPRLHDIRWITATQEQVEPMLPLIVSPTLTNFRLGLDILDPSDASSVIPVLEALAPAYNSLVEIRISGPTAYDPQTIHAVSTLLLRCNPDKLRCFSMVSALSAEAFIHATQLPNLKEFIITTDTTELDVPLPTSVFPSLKSLGINANNTDFTLLQTITHIQSRGLRNLDLEFPAAAVGTFLPTTLAALRPPGLHQTLTGLSISPEGDYDLDRTTLQPLLSLNQLTRLEINLLCNPERCSYKLSDEDLEELVEAMPKLELLLLGPFPCSRPANVTVKSLVSIAKNCKHLEELIIHTNVEAIVAGVAGAAQPGDWEEDTILGDPLSAFGGCPLRDILFGPCPIPGGQRGMMAFALTLLRLFPCLMGVTAFPLSQDREPQWESVNGLINTYRRVRINIAAAGKFRSSLPCTRFAHVRQLLTIWMPTKSYVGSPFSVPVCTFPPPLRLLRDLS